jgi:Domain of unknown function DUF11
MHSRAVAAIFVILVTAPLASAQIPNAVVSTTAAPNIVAANGLLTFWVTLSNTGTAAFTNVVVGIATTPDATLVSASSPAGTRAMLYPPCRLFDCSPEFTGAQIPTLAAGASAVFSIVVRVLSSPGGRVKATGIAFLQEPSGDWVQRSSIGVARVAGSAGLPIESSKLQPIGDQPTDVPNMSVEGPSDAAFDEEHGTYVIAGSHFEFPHVEPAITFESVPDAPTGFTRVLLEDFDFPFDTPRIAFSPLLGPDGYRGGVAGVWSSYYQVYAKIFPTAQIGTAVPIAIGTGAVARIEYSPAAQEFLVAWLTFDRELLCQRLALDGRPLGQPENVAVVSSFETAPEKIVWNPLTNEFALAYATTDASVGHGVVELARVASDGRVVGRTKIGHVSSSGPPLAAVNSVTGEYVVMWADLNGGNVLAAEVNAQGEVVSRGLIVDYDVLPRTLTFNPVSQTFLVIGEKRFGTPQTYPTVSWGVGTFPDFQVAFELNKYGAPLSASRLQQFQDAAAVTTRLDRAEWMVIGARRMPLWAGGLGTRTAQSQPWTTRSIDGGSDARLGGCVGRDPFVSIGGGVCYGAAWRPRAMSVPGMRDCSGPDPFVASSGGVCADGTWVPIRPVPTADSPLEPPPTPPGPPTPAAGCTQPDPFVSLGGGQCANGGWIPPGMTPPPGPPTGCTIPDPFVSLGGGVCVNGGWVPRQ